MKVLSEFCQSGSSFSSDERKWCKMEGSNLRPPDSKMHRLHEKSNHFFTKSFSKFRYLAIFTFTLLVDLSNQKQTTLNHKISGTTVRVLSDLINMSINENWHLKQKKRIALDNHNKKSTKNKQQFSYVGGTCGAY